MTNNKPKINKCIIIGSGPAGYSAAIYSARAGLNPILYTGNQIGGQLTTTTYIENYPGFPNKITGNQLMNYFQIQAKNFNTIIEYKSVIDILINNNNNQHTIYLNDGSIIKTIGIIIATGASPKYLNILNEKKFIGKGISFCAICDGFFYKGKTVAIVGGGDTALEEANYLSKICNQVYILVRKNVFKASKLMQLKIAKLNNIKILFNYQIINIIGDNTLETIIIKSNINNIEKKLKIDGLFIAIGHNPNTKLFKNKIDLDNKGYIITYNNNTMTNIPGIFASGDVIDSKYRQAITSASSGCMAALDLEKYISTQGGS